MVRFPIKLVKLLMTKEMVGKINKNYLKVYDYGSTKFVRVNWKDPDA